MSSHPHGDDQWAGTTYYVSASAGLGRLRAAALQDIIRSTGCSAQTRRTMAGPAVAVWGRRDLVEHLDATLDELVEQMDAAALAATRRYGAWLRGPAEHDHAPYERPNLRRAWRRAYLQAWGSAYASRLLQIATGHGDQANHNQPDMSHYAADRHAQHDVAVMDPTPLRRITAQMHTGYRRREPASLPPTDLIAGATVPGECDVARGASTAASLMEGPGLVGPGLRVTCLPGAVPARDGQPLADIISVGPRTSRVRICGRAGRVRRVPNELLRPIYAPGIAAEVQRRGLPVSYPNWRRLLPGWVWLGWTVAQHLEYARGERSLPTPAAPGRLVIVACGARKQTEFREHEAGRLYTGSYHRAARRAAEAIAGPAGKVMILSARYGLLSLDEPVLPYEQRLGTPGAVTVEYVREQARQMGLLPTADVVVLAGKAYAAIVTAIWPHAEAPLSGTTGIGHQMARLAAIATARRSAPDDQDTGAEAMRHEASPVDIASYRASNLASRKSGPTRSKVVDLGKRAIASPHGRPLPASDRRAPADLCARGPPRRDRPGGGRRAGASWAGLAPSAMNASGTGGRVASLKQATLHAPVAPMLAAPVEALPEGPGWAYEPKFDGWRTIAFRRENSVYLQSRTGKPLSGYFPDITRVLRASVPAGVVLDGELIVWQRDRTNFPLLQRRVSAGTGVLRMARDHPAHFVVFDLLRDADGRELLDMPLSERRLRLAAALADAPVQLPLCPQTTDLGQAREWLTAWTSAGIEGVVAKRLDSRYQPGRRGWGKQRMRLTTEALVGGVTGSVSDPQALLLGRFDPAGRLRYTGRSGQLPAYQRRELAPLLVPAVQRRSGGVDHPWPHPLPASWSGQFQQPEPLRYVQVQPTVVAEIEVDTAAEYHRWRHQVRYVQPRLDLSVYDVPLLLPPVLGRENESQL